MLAVRDNDPRSINAALIDLDRQLKLIQNKLGIKTGDTINNTTNVTNITNEVLDPVNVVEDGNMSAVTSNAVYTSLSSFFRCDRIRSGSITATGTYSLNGSYKFTDYDFILPIVTLYDSSYDMQGPIYPKAEIQGNINDQVASRFTISMYVGSTQRAVSFQILSDTQFKINDIKGTSGHLPRFWGFYGIKFGG